jgi:DNA-binding transcriptional LysR family regulator
MQSLNNVNMKLLQTFLAVAERGSFRLAADAVHRSHSAVSAQIQQLEEQLAVRLFERTTRSVALTEEGRLLRDSAWRALYELDLGLRQIRESSDLKRGQLSLASSPNLAAIYLPRVLAEFTKAYPQISVNVQELTSADLFEAARNRRVDFAIGPEAADSAFRYQTILDEPLQALVPWTYYPKLSKRIALGELVKLPLLLSNPATAIRALIDTKLHECGMTPAVRFQFIQSPTIIAMAEAGVGAAILPASSLSRALAPSARVLEIVEPTIRRKMALITLPNQVLSPAAARLADKIIYDVRVASGYRPTRSPLAAP